MASGSRLALRKSSMKSYGNLTRAWLLTSGCTLRPNDDDRLRRGVKRVDPLEARTIAKVSARLVPFLILCYFVAYLDRVNVSFAALTMNKDLGLSASAFGFGAGIFFLAYFLFEVPSNLFLERFGARKWIARIMFTWGLISGAHGVRRRRNELLRPAGAARRRRSRLLPRHHLLPDAVVPGGLPRAHHRLLHGGDSAVHGDRRAGVRPAARAGRLHGHEGMAVAVHHRSGAGADPVGGRVLLPDRPARRRHVAGAGRAGLAGEPPGAGAAAARDACATTACCRRC